MSTTFESMMSVYLVRVELLSNLDLFSLFNLMMVSHNFWRQGIDELRKRSNITFKEGEEGSFATFELRCISFPPRSFSFTNAGLECVMPGLKMLYFLTKIAVPETEDLHTIKDLYNLIECRDAFEMDHDESDYFVELVKDSCDTNFEFAIYLDGFFIEYFFNVRDGILTDDSRVTYNYEFYEYGIVDSIQAHVYITTMGGVLTRYHTVQFQEDDLNLIPGVNFVEDVGFLTLNDDMTYNVETDE